MNASAIRIILAASISTLIVTPALADSIKASNTTPLNDPGSWTNATVPGAADLAIWNSTVTAPNAPQLGGDLSWLGIQIGNVGGTRNTTNSAFLTIANTASANTLTLGASGIDMSNAVQALSIQARVAVSADQTWNIANANSAANPTGLNNGEDLAFRAQAAATPMNFGGNTVTTSGAGSITVSSGYTMSNGTLNVGVPLFVIQGGDSRLTTIDSSLTMNVNAGAALRLQSNSGALTSGAAINLNGGNLIVHVNNLTNAVTMSGNLGVLAPSTITVSSPQNAPAILSGNLTGSAALTLNNTTADAQRVLQFAGNNSGYSGTITLGGTAGRATRLTNAAAGSAAATWTVNTGHTLQVHGVSVDLGTLNGAGTVTNSLAGVPSAINVGAGTFSGAITNGTTGGMALTKSGPGTLTLTGANTYTGATTVSGGTLLVAPGVLGSTAVSVAGGATYAAQAAASGTVTPNVTVADGGTVLARPLAAGAQITMPSVAVGTVTGGVVAIDTGVLGNPTAAPLVATAFTPVAGTKVKILGPNLSTGLFPAIAYTGAIGGGGFGGLSLELPFRVSGGLVDGAGSVDVNISGVARPTWRGAIDSNWDIDSVGDGSTGTANWFAASGPNTYVEASVGVDSVVFDDTATGSTNVNLTTALSPAGTAVNNTTKNYVFSGSGKIGGVGALAKDGTGVLTIANTSVNDFAGGTFINDGTVRIGDGATSGAGSLGTGAIAIAAPATLELNRPDDFTLGNGITGTGTLKKSQPNVVTIPGVLSFGGSVDLAAGVLRFTAGGNLSGAVTGAGGITVVGGTLQLSGSSGNTYTGLTTVSNGTLQLNKTGADAVGGDLLITGTGGLTLSQPNQIADTATLTFNKTGQNQGTLILANETIGALDVVNGDEVGTQVQGQTGLVVTGDLSIANVGVFAIASNHSIAVGGVNLAGAAVLRIAANSNPSTLTVGAGGITASGGTVQVGQGTGAFDAVLNLGGDYTATGNVAFTDGGFTGAQKREINLGPDDRTFDIAAATTTTIAPDIAGAGGITKTGDGTLTLAGTSTYAGDTTVSDGVLTLLNTAGSATGSGDVIVENGATLAGTGTSTGTTTVEDGGILSPGTSIGTLHLGSLVLSADPILAFELAAPPTSDLLAVTGLVDIGNGFIEFDDFVFTSLAGFAEGTFTLIDSDTPITGVLGSVLTGEIAGLPAEIEISPDGEDLLLNVSPVPEPGSVALLALGALGLCRRRARPSR